MGFKLGDISPLAGAITGEGMTGKLLNPAEAARIAKTEQDRQAAAAEQANADRQSQIAAQYKGGMKKGGSVKSASQRADGCAIRGKTRA